MRTAPSRPILQVTLSIVLLTILAASTYADGQSDKVPAAVAALLPDAAKLTDGSWEVFDTDPGKAFSADMRATLPGRRLSCDSTVGPELNVELKGDTAWEAPPMLDMAVQVFNEEVSGARDELSQRISNLKASNSDIKSINAVKEEKLPNGHLIYLDYVESCGASGGTNSILKGFARRGATILLFSMWLSTDAAEASAMGKEMLARFAKLDIKALLK